MQPFDFLISWKDASVFNAGSWRIGNDFASFQVCNSNLREMKRRGLIVFAGDPPKGSDSVLLDLCVWELCFSLVSPLWELCYSLASC